MRYLLRKWRGWMATRRLRRHGLSGIYNENLRRIAAGEEPHRAW